MISLRSSTWAVILTVAVFGAGVAIIFFIQRPASPSHPPPRESFSVVVIPDTQGYAELDPKMFYAQMRWAIGKMEEYNVKFVMHVGDIVQTDSIEEWDIADRAFTIIEGAIPYNIALGNHDIEQARGLDNRDSTRANKYFPERRFAKRSWFGGTMDGKIENNYTFFSSAGMDFMVVTLEFGPRDVVLDWANALVRAYPQKRVIVVTHAYLSAEHERLSDTHRRHNATNYVCCRNGNDGEAIWEKFVRKHPNVFLVVSGHEVHTDRNLPTGGKLTSYGDHGNPVHQIMVNYQTQGFGWLRLLEFRPDDNKIESIPTTPLRLGIYTDVYSDFTDRRYFDLDPMGFHFRNDLEHAFTLDYDMSLD